MYTNISYLAGTSAQTHEIAVPQHFQLDKISGAKCNIPKSSLFHCLKLFQELFLSSFSGWWQVNTWESY